MSQLTVQHESGDRFAIQIRGHRVIVDQPGSGDAGPTPTELFVAGIAGCAGFFARKFLARHGIEDGELSVACDYTWASDHSRVEAVTLRIESARGIPEDLRPALVRVLEHCTVHESLRTPLTVTFEIETKVPVAV
jgi:uncharacterized OsmC-like protein